MNPLVIEMTFDHQQTLLAEAAEHRRALAVRPQRRRRPRLAVFARVRRTGRRVAAPLSA